MKRFLLGLSLGLVLALSWNAYAQATDPFVNQPVALESPATHAFSITPNDSADLSTVTRGVYVGGAGNMVATMQSGEEVTFNGLVAGTLYPIRVRRVDATNTTATNLIGVY